MGRCEAMPGGFKDRQLAYSEHLDCRPVLEELVNHHLIFIFALSFPVWVLIEVLNVDLRKEDGGENAETHSLFCNYT